MSVPCARQHHAAVKTAVRLEQEDNSDYIKWRCVGPMGANFCEQQQRLEVLYFKHINTAS